LVDNKNAISAGACDTSDDVLIKFVNEITYTTKFSKTAFSFALIYLNLAMWNTNQ